MKTLPKIGHREYLEKEIKSYSDLMAELEASKDENVLLLTHDKAGGYAQRVQVKDRIKRLQMQIAYYYKKVKHLKEQLANLPE